MGIDPEVLADVVDAPDEGDEPVPESDEFALLPWYKRPSAWWLISLTPLTAVATACTLAPRVEIYTRLACAEIRPEFTPLTYREASAPQHLALAQPFGDFGLSSKYLEYEVDFDRPLPRSNTSGYEPAPNKLPPTTKQCSSDPKVQAAVSSLIAVMGTLAGILTCLTTAFWGSLSDRYGRKPIMSLAITGFLVSDFNFILVARAAKYLPGGYRFIMFGPIFDGLLGGMSTWGAASHAYMADCTLPHARARIFSLSMGLLFTGIGIGPTLGSFLIRATGDLLSVFYLATAAHIGYALFVFFIIPESLSKKSMLENRKRVSENHDNQFGFFLRVFSFLRPVATILPKRVVVPGTVAQTRLDWNLTFLAAASALVSFLFSSFQIKFQYAQAQFGWTSEQLGYWLSAVGAARAFHLMISLPLFIKYFKPKPPIHLPSSASEPLLNDPASPPKPATAPVKHHSPKFDILLLRLSLAIEVVAYSSLIFFRTPQWWFIATIVGAFGSGFGPALQSIALEVYARRGETEAGKLFGALSVVNSLCSSILGPMIYGATYITTVVSFPQAIFVVSGAFLSTAFIFSLFVRIRDRRADGTLDEDHVEYTDGDDAEPQAQVDREEDSDDSEATRFNP
ncbi:MFS general substrate transporter [Sistotremastrum suecicum HHB10207 ss-3]|uniref:MFS general substrate transporter n=1 Tax=Sistotremastrum suecicum HHB10207 ss-3 TaxID=1314776 RepID=A0A166A813_9AGAM|nr:MFS general substrate transporter [Sistotremastrum suecicum HHB10207 ss-3]